jgi:hypothetical protein
MNPLAATARMTGLLYLVLAITGALSFLVVRPALFVPDDAAATLANLVEQEALARLGIVLELLTVLSQSLLAIWFFKLFRSVNVTAAVSLAAFGLVNAVAILGSSAFLATALAVATDPTLSSASATAETAQLMYQIAGEFWAVGNLFFGLWLIPMGRLVLASRWMPRPLGWVLIAGGVSYVLSAFIVYLVPNAPELADTVLSLVATVGEVWMIGYLLIFGVRRGATVPVHKEPTLA